MSARAREQFNPGRQTPHRTANSRSPSEHRHRQLQRDTLLTALENMEALERVVEGAPDLEEQGRRGHQPRAPLHFSGSDHRSPASSSKHSTSQQFVQPQQHEAPHRHEMPIPQPVTDSVTLTYQCLDVLEQTKMSQCINGTAAKCLRATVANSPGIAALPRIEAKAVGKAVGENEISLEIILKVSGDENIVAHISNCVETLRTIADALIPGEDDDNSSRMLIHHSADFLLSTLDTLFTEIVAKPGPNPSIESCSISQLSPRAMVVAEGLYPDFIPMWGIVPSTLEEALISRQALVSTTGKVYMFGDLSHLMHQRRNMMKMTTNTLTEGPHVAELMTSGFGKSDTPPLDPAAKPASTRGGSDRGDSNVDLKSHKQPESGDSEQPSPIMTVNIDMLRFRPGYANIEDRRKIRASKLLEDTANEVAHLFQSLNEHVPESYYDDRITAITQHTGIITVSGGLSMLYFLHDVIRWMNTEDGGECLATATDNIIPGETKGPWAQKPCKEAMATLMLEALDHAYHQHHKEYQEDHKSLTFYKRTLSEMMGERLSILPIVSDAQSQSQWDEIITYIDDTTVRNWADATRTDDLFSAFMAPDGQRYMWGSADSIQLFNTQIDGIYQQLEDDAGKTPPHDWEQAPKAPAYNTRNDKNDINSKCSAFGGVPSGPACSPVGILPLWLGAFGERAYLWVVGLLVVSVFAGGKSFAGGTLFEFCW